MAKLIAKANALDKSILLELLEASGLPDAAGIYGPGSGYNGPEVDPRSSIPKNVFSSTPGANQSILGNFISDPLDDNAQGIRRQEITNFHDNKYLPNSTYDADGGQMLRQGKSDPGGKNELDYFRGGPESWDTRGGSTGTPNRYHPRIDGKDNIYGPDFDITSVKDMAANLKHQLGFSFAGRIKHEVGAGKIMSTLLTKAVLYAMNPLPGMIINPLMPWIAPLSHGVGPNLNTVDGALGSDYVSYTEVDYPDPLGIGHGSGNPAQWNGGSLTGKIQGTMAKATGNDPSKGNLIYQSPAAADGKPSTIYGEAPPIDGLKIPTFHPRSSMVGNAVDNAKEYAKGKIGNKIAGLASMFGSGRWTQKPGTSTDLELFSDVAFNDPDRAYKYVGKYGQNNNKRFTAQHFLGNDYLSNRFPSGWEKYEQTYTDGRPGLLPDGTRREQQNKYVADEFGDGVNNPWQETLPLIITDLRNPTEKKIYFRAFVSSLTEKYAPDWKRHDVFARPEPYYQWMKCSREFDFRLKFVVFAPSELNVMYKKLNFLSQLQYGTFGETGRPLEPPLCRLLLGDLIKKTTANSSMEGSPSSSDGLTGFIDGLNISYPDSNWEMIDGSKVPKSFDVSIGFKVIHEAAVSGDATFYDLGDVSGIGTTRMKSIFNSMR